MLKKTLASLEKVSFVDKQSSKTILQDISLQLEPSQIVTVIGPNGAGKTTLLKIILGLITPSQGKIWRKPNLKVGYMPQKIEVNPFLPLTVDRLLQLCQKEHIPAPQIDAALEKVQVPHLKNQNISVLSGGEWQRVLLARALLRQPDLLVLDEPAQGVDIIGQSEFYQLLARLRNQLHCGIILVSHDLHLVMAESDQVICLNGHICCSGHPEAVINDPQYQGLFGTARVQTQVIPGLAPYTHHHDHRHDCIHHDS